MDKIRIYIALLFCQAISFILPVQAQDNTGSDSNWYNTLYSYDGMGNITSLSRNGLLDDGSYDYYPYGGLMSNSTEWNTQRYKYNGKELDRMHGLDWYDYGARWMDAAIGRWHVMDPLCEKYYDVSPYAYCAGDPVNAIDPDGDTIFYMRPILQEGNVINYEKYSYKMVNGEYAFYDNFDNKYKGGNTYLTNLQSSLSVLSQGDNGLNIINELSGVYNVEIKHGYNGIEGNKVGSTISWDSQDENNGGIDINGSSIRPSYIGLGHELAHAVDFKNNTILKGDWVPKSTTTNRIPNFEKYACYVENLLRREHNIPLRKYYSAIGNKGFEPTLILNKPYW